MKKVTIRNIFHRTEVTVLSNAASGREAWIEICAEALGEDRPRERRKAMARYNRVKKALCGVHGCQCGNHIV